MNQELLKTKDIHEFIDALKDMRGFASLNTHLLTLLLAMRPNTNLTTQKFLVLCFSLMDDGNARLPMSEAAFKAMWNKKWEGLVQLKISSADSDLDESAFAQSADFTTIIRDGIKDILTSDFEQIILRNDSNKPLAEDALSKPFILAMKEIAPEHREYHLYFTKLFNAKCNIEESAQRLFRNGIIPTDGELASCIEDIRKIHKPIRKKDGTMGDFLVNREQAQAILRGLDENLIITGGPGTGKTTVVLYILWKLLEENPEMLDWDIYLAAPSGKAADRMRESLTGGLEGLTEETKDAEKNPTSARIFKKLKDLESSTIHRLLKFSHAKGDFFYNQKDQFPRNSIFVIDEASMIDLEMFAALLQAIPDEARLFILGDPYQLPSVDSGAVLGEILKPHNSTKNFTVKLEISNRFDDASNIGKLAKEIKVVAESKDAENFVAHPFVRHPALAKKDPANANTLDNSCDPDNARQETPDSSPQEKGSEQRSLAGEQAFIPKDFVHYYQADATEDSKKITKKEADKRVEALIADWVKDISSLPELAAQIDPTFVGKDDIQTPLRDKLWNLSLTRRMLSAERKGPWGVESLNKKACSRLKKIWKNGIASAEEADEVSAIQDSGYFPGQFLIITQNQEMYKLYNGDTGIVVFDRFTPYLMLKKAPPQGSNIERDNYVFYPLAVLPADAIESAFAITIHKSQGSEYSNVTMFLPTNIGHPLLTNQIIYTGITRAKESVDIIASPETFKAACCTVTERETGIEL